MRLSQRIAKAEMGLSDALLRLGLKRISSETGEPFDALYRDAQEVLRKYRHLMTPLPGDMVDLEPALRAVARDEGLEYAELENEANAVIRQLNARERRRRRR